MRAFLRNATDPLYELKRRARFGAAKLWRDQFHKTVFVGVTGSHGKTTAVALLSRILETQGPTKAGISHNLAKTAAQNVLRTKPWHHRYYVQEISAYPPGVIQTTMRFLRPTVGVVTAIGGDHQREFRTLEATAAEKARLVHGLPADGLAVLNADDPHVAGMESGCRCKVVTYGRNEAADLRLVNATSAWPERLSIETVYREHSIKIDCRLVGVHWTVSVLAALLTALELGISRTASVEAIEAFEPKRNRMSVHSGPAGAWYVLDAEKASYSGIEACLGFLEDADSPRKTVIFGSIADRPNGGDSRNYRRVARMALARADRVIFTGESAPRVRKLVTGEFAGRLFAIEEPTEVAERIANEAIANEIIYIKASGNDRLERYFVGAGAPRN